MDVNWVINLVYTQKCEKEITDFPQERKLFLYFCTTFSSFQYFSVKTEVSIYLFFCRRGGPNRQATTKMYQQLFTSHKSQNISFYQLPVFQVLGLDLGHLAAREVKNLLAEQFEDDHVVLTEALAGPTRTHNITDEGGPVFGPFLLQDLNREEELCVTSLTTSCRSRVKQSNVYSPVRGSCWVLKCTLPLSANEH